MKTRMERYKERREKISSEVQDIVQNHELSHYANRLNKIDQDTFEDMSGMSPDYEPTRAKEIDLKMYETFENEYLKDFLDEVKSYNIEKGNRFVGDTEQNILEELNAQHKDETLASPNAPEDAVLTQKELSESQAFTFDQMLEDITSEEILNDSVEKDLEVFLEELNFSQTSELDVLISEEILAEQELLEAKGLEEIVDEVLEETVEEITEAAIVEEIVEEALEVAALEEEHVSQEFDPFREEYLEKMQALEKDIDASFETEDSKPEPEVYAEPIGAVEPRDITQEFLELTREIEREELESPIEIKDPEIVLAENEVISDEEVLEELEVMDIKEVRKNRFVNAVLTLALAGIILGVAVAIKYLIL